MRINDNFRENGQILILKNSQKFSCPPPPYIKYRINRLQLQSFNYNYVPMNLSVCNKYSPTVSTKVGNFPENYIIWMKSFLSKTPSLPPSFVVTF